MHITQDANPRHEPVMIALACDEEAALASLAGVRLERPTKKRPARAAAGERTSVVTRRRFAAAAERVWGALMFYEEIDERPPPHLRWLLPVPLGTEGGSSRIGDEAKCLYVGGYLIKRVTQVDLGRIYGFEVTEQHLAVGGGMTLLGGDYALRVLPGGSTEVTLSTRYASARRPRWLWRPVEAAVCHMFHRHLLGAMQRIVESR